MNNHISSQDDQEPSPQTRRATAEKRPDGLLALWYRMTSPPEPAKTASFQERDLFRRGRTGSQVSIVIFVFLLLSFPATFVQPNALLAISLITNFLIVAVALVLNRVGRINLAGILTVFSVFGPMINISTTPGGLNTTILPAFSLLMLPLMCAASFLPPIWIFVVAAINMAFTVFAFTVLPNVGELHAALKAAFPAIIIPILLSQFIVSIVAYIWVRGAKQAILRADRAEEIAALERREIERQQSEIEQKQQLDMGIQQVILTHTQVANGDFTARAPLAKGDILWQVAYSLNNLLARLQSYQMLNAQQRRSQEALSYLTQAIQRAKKEGRPLQLQRTGTPVDALILELSSINLTEPVTRPRFPSASSQNSPDPR